MKEQLLQFISGYLSNLDQIQKVSPEAKLLDLMDSLEVFDLVSAISNEFGTKLPEEDILMNGQFRKMTIEDLINVAHDSTVLA